MCNSYRVHVVNSYVLVILTAIKKKKKKKLRIIHHRTHGRKKNNRERVGLFCMVSQAYSQAWSRKHPERNTTQQPRPGIPNHGSLDQNHGPI